MSRFECAVPLSTLSSQLNSKSQIPKFTEVLMENLILKSESINSKIHMHHFNNFQELWKGFTFEIVNLVNTDYFIQVTYLIMQSKPITQKFYFLVNIHYHSQYQTNIFAEAQIIEEKESKQNYKVKIHNKIVINSDLEIVEKMIRDYNLFHQICPTSADAIKGKSKYLQLGDVVQLHYYNNKNLIFELTVTELEKTENSFLIDYNVENIDKNKNINIHTPFQYFEFYGRIIGPSKIELHFEHFFKDYLKEGFIKQFSNEKDKILQHLKEYAENEMSKQYK